MKVNLSTWHERGTKENRKPRSHYAALVDLTHLKNEMTFMEVRTLMAKFNKTWLSLLVFLLACC